MCADMLSVVEKIESISKGELIAKIEDLLEDLKSAERQSQRRLAEAQHRFLQEAEEKAKVLVNDQIRANNELDNELNKERFRRANAEATLNELRELLSRKGLSRDKKVAEAVDHIKIWHTALGQRLVEEAK